jgi:hypothetical protein
LHTQLLDRCGGLDLIILCNTFADCGIGVILVFGMLHAHTQKLLKINLIYDTRRHFQGLEGWISLEVGCSASDFGGFNN